MTPLPDDLARALDDALDPIPTSRLTPIVERLIGDYRIGRAGTATAILRTPDDAAAYAAYRMPATYAAVREALGQAADVAVGLAPRTLVDVGGGTGAAVWAATDVWASLEEAIVLEGSDPVIAFGRRLVATAGNAAVASTTFRPLRMDTTVALPDADLITVSYVLGELDEGTRTAVVREAAARGGTVAVIEPGTPDGYRRVLAARDELLAGGLTVVAPCPHDGPCPVAVERSGTDDWCHFAARVNRSARHRRLKSGDLGHEDEKFAHVVAVRSPSEQHAANRVVRHPLQRKGLVTLRLCTGAGGITDRPVPKSRRDDYRAARDTSWGDAWPPRDHPGS
ncbi:small ribosomal subunit Rsm22 family protein [Pseudonocardia endophytica]|uniref:Ribosomal protein RSM22 (Predicted rRNA methylase) n=1 Tax=Pseudonocardia endophytica TaxID=401976 RepID=A0A4R1I657_PSEEN|nr:small ribosomal subunit Rsm22 family protein [Pseudonocardia endophytica]TCK25572.1 ribosomal protein RSM22 (predicted rRNA methylase) [Pseudonocardia endophytica]